MVKTNEYGGVRLSAADERDLIVVAQLGRGAGSGDLDAVTRRKVARAEATLMSAHMGLLAQQVTRFSGRGVPDEDLWQEARLGWWHALGKFDTGQGTRLSTYVVPWIAQYLQRAVAKTGRAIRVPEHRLPQLAALAAERDGIVPVGPVPVKAEDVSRADRDLLTLHLTGPASLDAAVGVDGQTVTLGESLISTVAGPEDVAEASEMHRLVAHLLGKLGEQDRAVVTARFGLGGGEARSRAQVAALLGMTASAVRHGERRGLEALRAAAIVEVDAG